MEEKKEDAARQVVYLSPGMHLDGEELDLLAVGKILWRWKWFVGGLTFFFSLAAVLVSLFYLPVLYQSQAVIQPVVAPKASMALMAKIAPLISDLGLPSLGSGEENSLLMVNFLSSRTIKEKIIKDFDLLPRIYFKDWDSKKKAWKTTDPEDVPTAVKAIQKEDIDYFYGIDHDRKSGLISVLYLDRDPAFAAKVVDGVIQELDKYLKYDYVTDAKRNLIFVEGELKRAVKELEYWERQIPDRNHTESEILRERGTALVVYTELRKQYELARIQEARELIAFKVLDKPLVPEKKAKPKRAIICVVTFSASFFIAVFAAFFLESMMQARKRNRDTDLF